MRRLYTAAGKPRSIQSTPIIAAAAFALVVIVHHNTVCSVYPAVAATSSSFATPAAPLWRALGADRGLSSLQALQQSEDTSDRGNGKITIWNPDRPCSGTFASGPAPNSPDGFPYAIIREAVIDRRYASRVQFRRQTGEPNEPFERLVLYVTVHLSVTPSLKNASVSLVALDGKRLKSADGMIANVDVVQKVFSFSEMPGPYTPGMLSKRGHEVHEWQVIVSLRPGTVAKAAASDSAFMAHLQEMATNAGAALQLSIPLQRFDGEELFFTPAFSLSCVIGWEHSAVFPKDSRFHSGRTCTKGAQDSIVLGSNALYGIKRHDASHYREIAHFAARTMYGSMRFDAVAMPVIVNNTQSEANLLCGGNEECLEGQRVANRKLLESVAETVEQELDALGVPRSLFNKIIFVPACRLGSHATGSELGEPCSASQRYGQHHVTFFTYTLFSSYFKWAGSHDLDEYFARSNYSTNRVAVAAERASDVFDEASIRGGDDAMVLTWINFSIREDQLDDVTRIVMNGTMPSLRHSDDDEESKNCYVYPKDEMMHTGKGVVRCDTGLGMTVHNPVTIRWRHGMTQSIRENYNVQDIRTWHARLNFTNRGRCEFFEGGTQTSRIGQPPEPVPPVVEAED